MVATDLSSGWRYPVVADQPTVVCTTHNKSAHRFRNKLIEIIIALIDLGGWVGSCCLSQLAVKSAPKLFSRWTQIIRSGKINENNDLDDYPGHKILLETIDQGHGHKR